MNTLNLDHEGEVSLEDFVDAAQDPGQLKGDMSWGDALAHSHRSAVALAKCKLATVVGDHAEAHQRLNEALRHFGQVHGAIHRGAAQAVAKETDLKPRAEAFD
jgi:hypothetical protein